ncbi:MAG: nitrous oxide-stimulated promoter family protein [Elusimicrobia bacterium]|nr:nitrous oxide-stimulated promoter family protein [Elusimicrobiota bacterium]
MTAADIERHEQVLSQFAEVYCRQVHPGEGDDLCAHCRDLLAYAHQRLVKCPFDPKPKCKDCKVHCYQSDYRDRMREVMRFSGMYFVKRGRLDWLIRYFMM